MEKRTCKDCGKAKELTAENFRVNKRVGDYIAYSTRCIPCALPYEASQRKKHQVARAARIKAQREKLKVEDPDYLSRQNEKMKVWRDANPEKAHAIYNRSNAKRRKGVDE